MLDRKLIVQILLRNIVLLTLIMSMLLIPGCKNNFESRYKKLERFIQKNPVGPSGDYWLVKITFLGSDRVGLVFGFPSNYAFCQELADAQNKIYPGAKVSCERVQ